ncbi:MAG: hypothetical protein P8R42_20930 [Candidatus Binatia bacterium]|nr:hypothetical protein [Candidatus Binatia bacterium]
MNILHVATLAATRESLLELAVDAQLNGGSLDGAMHAIEGAFVYRVSNRSEADAWLARSTLADFRSRTSEDALILLDAGF